MGEDVDWERVDEVALWQLTHAVAVDLGVEVTEGTGCTEDDFGASVVDGLKEGPSLPSPPQDSWVETLSAPVCVALGGSTVTVTVSVGTITRTWSAGTVIVAVGGDG